MKWSVTISNGSELFDFHYFYDELAYLEVTIECISIKRSSTIIVF